MELDIGCQENEIDSFLAHLATLEDSVSAIVVSPISVTIKFYVDFSWRS